MRKEVGEPQDPGQEDGGHVWGELEGRRLHHRQHAQLEERRLRNEEEVIGEGDFRWCCMLVRLHNLP